MITWPIFVALFLAVLAIYFKVKAENKAIEKEKELREKEEKEKRIEEDNQKNE